VSRGAAAPTVRYLCLMKLQWRRFFRRETKRAARLVDNPIAVLRAADHAAEMARDGRGAFRRIWDDLQASVRLVRAWARRDYRGVHRSTLVLMVAGFLYLVSPVDAIADVIPVVGLIDDAAVLAWVLRRVRAELDQFRGWESQRQLPPTELAPS
jgi:uncharacterized membrane protein YkvA (DUF1232 family)